MGTIVNVNGLVPQVTQFTAIEDVVRRNPEDSSGGTGGATASAVYRHADFKRLYGKPFYWNESTNQQFNPLDSKTFGGEITAISRSEGANVTFTAESAARALNAIATVEPYSGPLWACLEHIVQSVQGLFITGFSFSLGEYAVVPAHRGNVWVFLKQFMQVHDLYCTVEVTDVGLTPTLWFHKNDYSVNDEHRVQGHTSFEDSISGDNLARQVAVEYYGNEYIQHGTVYPMMDEEPQLISVDAGSVIEVELTTKTGMSSVNQPIAMDILDQNYTGEGTYGAYTIAGSDGLGISASAWTSAGGSVRVRIKEDDPYTLIVTVTAPTKGVLATPNENNTAAPYHIAMTDGELTPRLFITGTGVRTNPKTITVDTGVTTDFANDGVGFTLTNPCVGTRGQALDMALRLAQSYGGPALSVSYSKPMPKTHLRILNGLFESEGHLYRVNSVNYSKGSMSVSAYEDTPIRTFNEKYGTLTFAQFNALWADQDATFRDFHLQPLRDQ